MAILQVNMRNDLAADWTSDDPVLLLAEIGYETDTGYWKWGDGVTAWTSLSYAQNFGGDVTVAGTLVVTGLSTFNEQVTFNVQEPIINTPSPFMLYQETDAAADNANWLFGASGEAWLGIAYDDAYTNFYQWLTVERSGTGAGTQVDTIDIIAETDITFTVPTFDVQGDITLTGTVDGIDVAGRDHDAVTLVGAGTYLSLATQQITQRALLEADISNLFTTIQPRFTVVTETTTSRTAVAWECILVDDDTAAADVTITLPPSVAGVMIVIKKLGTTADVIIDGDGTEPIDGNLTFAGNLTAQYASITLIADGSGWNVI